jgi:hypothetical protein
VVHATEQDPDREQDRREKEELEGGIHHLRPYRPSGIPP